MIHSDEIYIQNKLTAVAQVTMSDPLGDKLNHVRN